MFPVILCIDPLTTARIMVSTDLSTILFSKCRIAHWHSIVQPWPWSQFSTWVRALSSECENWFLSEFNSKNLDAYGAEITRELVFSPIFERPELRENGQSMMAEHKTTSFFPPSTGFLSKSYAVFSNRLAQKSSFQERPWPDTLPCDYLPFQCGSVCMRAAMALFTSFASRLPT